MAGVGAAAWDGLDHGRQPFTRHAFLRALEVGESVGGASGWQPLPVLLWDGDVLRGAIALYGKLHSWGEYVFDHGWAQAAEGAGLRWYPKLVAAVPFTPVTGPRLLLGDRGDDTGAAMLVGAAWALAEQGGASSLHWLFVDRRDRERLLAMGFAARRGMQYHHWDGPHPDGDAEGHAYGSWAGFLASMRSDKRRELLRERRRLADAGIEILRLRGDTMDDTAWLAAERFYRSTVDRKWGEAYLRPAFFQAVRDTMGPSIRFYAARRDGRIIAGALCWEGEGALFGRHWGCDEYVPGLHFECCYHAPMEDGFARGLTLFEAGAQGEHKVARGFVPRATWSLHRVRHAGLDKAIRDFLGREDSAVRDAGEELAAAGPWKREP